MWTVSISCWSMFMEEIDRSISSCVIAILYKMILYHIKTYCAV
jgi:hypothetical protein